MGRAFEFRKSRKLKRWSAMSKSFTKLSKEIQISVKENGPSPDSNSRLRALIQNAKSVNMPKDNIDRAINKSINKSKDNLKKIFLEGYGPFGIAILVEAITDNNNRTVANIRSYFKKENGTLGKSGTVEYLFKKIIYFEISNTGINHDEIELELIDYGLLEIIVKKKYSLIIGSFENFNSLQLEIEKRKIEIINSGFDRIPNNLISVDKNKKDLILELINVIENDPDVQNVYHNLNI
tara:strand:+ start:141 stop:851 length:711 start_codon:yes stop_codon:yes gene_type:complete